MKKIAVLFERSLHLEKRFGIPNWFVYHLWNLVIIFDSLGKYIIYNTDLFGHYTIRKGILGMYSVIYPAIAIAILYTISLIESGADKVYMMVWVYKLQVVVLYVAITCYGIDAVFFIFDKKVFCKLQLEKIATCDSRNEYFLVTVTIFYLFWTPIWLACNMSIYKYTRQMA